MKETGNNKLIMTGIIIMIALLTASLLLFISEPKLTWEALDRRLIISRSLFWLIVLIIWLYAKKIEKQPLILNNRSSGGFVFYLLSITALMCASFIVSLITNLVLHLAGIRMVMGTKMALVMQVFHHNKLFLFLTVITAGVTEEILFRGYMLPRLQLIFKNNAVAVIISSLLFGLMHSGYGTIQNVIVPVFIGVVFSLYYIRYKNIAALMIAHALYDLLAVYISMQMYYKHLKGA